MDQIGRFALQNMGGFVTRLDFEYYSDKTRKWSGVSGTGDITLGRTKSADPGDYGVPDGSMIRMKAFVVWGSDRVADQMFIYKKNSKVVAEYIIRGTTMSNKLEFRGLVTQTLQVDSEGGDGNG